MATNYNIGVFTRIKDEPNIEEFIIYYYNLGFRIFLFNDDYSCQSVKSIIDNNLNINKLKDIKTLIYTFENKDDSLKYLNNTAFWDFWMPKIKENMDYCLYVDMDEYLVLRYNLNNINDVIEFYKPFDQLKINWLFYGNNNHKQINNFNSYLKNFIMSNNELNKHCKVLVDTKKIIGCNNPHYFIMEKNSIIKNINNIETNNGPFEDNTLDLNIKKLNIYISHFMTGTTEMFFKRRFLRKTDNLIDQSQLNIDIINNTLIFYNNNKDTIINYIHNMDLSNDYLYENIPDISDIYYQKLINMRLFFKQHNTNIIHNPIINNI